MSGAVALVIPWFGRELTGGAEQHAWQIATRLAARGHEVEVLTTCGASFAEDWSTDHHPAGRRVEDGLAVRRFPLRRRDRTAFDAANRRLLELPRASLRPGVCPVDPDTADCFVRENVHAPELVRHLEREGGRYRAAIFLPYLYGPILTGVDRLGARGWLQPCLHDEAYAYLPQVATAFARAGGLLFNSEGEAALAARLYGPAVWSKGVVVGGGIEPLAASVPLPAAARSALERAGDRFFLYLGRRDPTKNVDLLLRAFARTARSARLVLVGPGPQAAGALPPGAVDLGLVDEATKAALLAHCLAVVQPSRNESFSRAMMEGWLVGRPVIVHRACLATSWTVAACGGGLCADGEDEWVAVLDEVAAAPPERLATLGAAGRAHAREAADWDRAMERYERALGLVAPASGAAPRRPAPRGAAIHQLLPTLVPGDAIGNHARFLRDWLRGLGYRSQILARHLDPSLAGECEPFGADVLHPGDGLVYHHSIGSEVTPAAVAHRGPKLLVFHNVTPSAFFAPYQPAFAALLEAGREELKALAPAFPDAVGVSAFDAADLAAAGFRTPGVLPIPVEPGALGDAADPEWMERLQDGARNVLFVGRLAPNKRQEHLVALLAHLLAFEPRARLVLVGPETPGDPYASCVRLLADRLGVAERVWFAGAVSPARLQACYRTAHLFASLSEHEGFGVPLVEAMWFDVPVLAYRAAAVPETLGKAGLLVTEKRWPELAALAARLLRDGALREKVLRAQRRRRLDFRFAALEPAYAARIAAVFGGLGA